MPWTILDVFYPYCITWYCSSLMFLLFAHILLFLLWNVFFFFYVPWRFKNWMIMALHNFLSFIVLRKVCLFPPSFYFNIHLHKLIRWLTRCFTLPLFAFDMFWGSCKYQILKVLFFIVCSKNFKSLSESNLMIGEVKQPRAWSWLRWLITCEYQVL